ncbi:MAG: hypothetical protein RLZ10_2683 [Bacteroidota bacterium]|jgi:2-polyprenyl-3-methyl-5-hydroxy-6-metoxy-1,4-benzoquinol methylase
MGKFSKEKLELIAGDSLYTTFTNSMTINYSFEVFKRFIKPGKLLELGPAEGLMTQHFIKIDPELTVIEGSENFADKLRINFPQINVINSLFEETQLNQQFDTIILGHVLEHVEDANKLLKHIKPWLKENGVILCAVPNARSIHRQAAVDMGLISNIFEMSEKDLHHGHLRIFTPESLLSEFINAGYKIDFRGGYWLKPLNDKQIESIFTEEMLKGFMKLGEFYPDIAGEIYVVAKK